MVAAMKRVLEWAFWAIGAVAIAYLALYLYASLTGRQFEPGDPIHIFRSPDAPDYSAATAAGLG
jgi:bacteriorhodopsin